MPATYRFADFHLLPEERLLLRQGVPVPLTARAFGVLAALAERAGQLVSKDELMQRVWAGVIVEDNNIAVHIAQLRKVLGARAISTIAGCGYRFALDVAPDDPGVGAPGDAADRPGNLPARLAPLIGRERELAELLGLIQARPLVTVCGGAGVGKTHLAMAAALQSGEHHSDGVYWVDLAPLTASTQILPTLCRALGLKPATGDDPLAVLSRRLRPLSLLLVLDNAEHLADEVDRLATALVQATRRVALLITSQVPLRGTGQYLYRLGPLQLPQAGASPEQSLHSGALQLLAERAAGAGSAPVWDAPSLAAAAEICTQLDGNPLAIELAAARIPALGLAGLAARLEQRLGLLAPLPLVPPSRQNALAAAFDWSHGLLSAPEQIVFRRLAIFPGGFELDTAALCVADEALGPARVVEIILDLVDRSLVNADRAHAPRYRLLETGRLYAREKLLASGEALSARRAFARGMRRALDDAYEAYWETAPEVWRRQWEPEIDNLRAAMEEATGSNDAETAAALFGSSWPLWHALSLEVESRGCTEAVVRLLTPALPRKVLARFWEAVARCHTVEFPQRCRAAAELAAQLYGELGDARGQYLAWVEYAFNWRVDHPEARLALARAKAIENPRWPARVLARRRTTEATLDTAAGRFDLACAAMQSVVDLYRRDRDSPSMLRAQANVADVHRAAGRIDEAVHIGETLFQQRQNHRPEPDEFTALGNLIGALVAQGSLARAKEVIGLGAARMRRLADDSCLWTSLDSFALLHGLDGRIESAARLAGAADRAYRDHGQHARQPNEATDRERLARLLGAIPDARQVAAWRLEGEGMAYADALDLAFSIGG